jgi:hypothetical protein
VLDATVAPLTCRDASPSPAVRVPIGSLIRPPAVLVFWDAFPAPDQGYTAQNAADVVLAAWRASKVAGVRLIVVIPWGRNVEGYGDCVAPVETNTALTSAPEWPQLRGAIYWEPDSVPPLKCGPALQQLRRISGATDPKVPARAVAALCDGPTFEMYSERWPVENTMGLVGIAAVHARSQTVSEPTIVALLPTPEPLQRGPCYITTDPGRRSPAINLEPGDNDGAPAGIAKYALPADVTMLYVWLTDYAPCIPVDVTEMARSHRMKWVLDLESVASRTLVVTAPYPCPSCEMTLLPLNSEDWPVYRTFEGKDPSRQAATFPLVVPGRYRLRLNLNASEVATVPVTVPPGVGPFTVLLDDVGEGTLGLRKVEVTLAAKPQKTDHYMVGAQFEIPGTKGEWSNRADQILVDNGTDRGPLTFWCPRKLAVRLALVRGGDNTVIGYSALPPSDNNAAITVTINRGGK